MGDSILLKLALIGVLGYVLTTCVLVTLAARARLFKARHDLLVSTKQMRADYMRVLAQRAGKLPADASAEAAAHDDEIIEAEVVGQLSGGGSESAMRQAA